MELGDDDRHLCHHDEELEWELALELEGKEYDGHRPNHDEELELGSVLVLALELELAWV